MWNVMNHLCHNINGALGNRKWKDPWKLFSTYLCYHSVTAWKSYHWYPRKVTKNTSWTSYQIRKIASCTCRERFPRHRLQRKPLVSDPGMHHGPCITHVPWHISGSLTRGGGENVPSIPGTCTTCKGFVYTLKRCLNHTPPRDSW